MESKNIASDKKTGRGLRKWEARLDKIFGWKPLMPLTVFLLFVLSAVIHGLIMPGPHVVNIYYDEALSWGLAKSFWKEPFTVYHMPVEYSKFVYAMALSPLYLIGDPILRSELAMWLNAVMISFAVFPAYGLVKKISASPKVRLASLVLFMCSPIMNYSEKYVPECLYLPMILYLMLGYYTLYQHVGDPACSLRKLNVCAVLLGVFAYAVYLEREATLAFFGGFLIWSLIAAAKCRRRKDERWKRYLSAALLHLIAAGACHWLTTKLLGLGFSYSEQFMLDNINSMYKIEYLIHCLIANGLYLCAAFFGLPVLYWQLKRNRRGRLAEEGAAHRDWVVFLSAAFFLTLAFLSFSVSVKEELGNVNMRWYTRYFIPFLFPLFALVLEEIRKAPQRARRAGMLGVLIVGAACLLLLAPNRYVSDFDSLDTWHIQELNKVFDDMAPETEETEADGEEEASDGKTPLELFFADQTDGSKEIVYNHGLVFSMLAFTLWMILIVWLAGRRKKAAFAVLCMAALAVEGYNNVMTVQRFKIFGDIPAEEARAYAQLDRDVIEVAGDENILLIHTARDMRKRKTDTFFSFDFYSVLTKDLKAAMGENGVIDLKSTSLRVSMDQFTGEGKYPAGTLFPYVLCGEEIIFNEDSMEQVLYSEETNYYLYKVLDPAILDVDLIFFYEE
ncbi:MAG: hypothetical protein IJQ62_07715 [Clostridia bacterium]|nr:hypothetical protein [Clostridia bacterium]